MKKYVFMTLASIALAMPVNAQFFHGLVEKAVEKQVEKKVAEKISPKSANQSSSDQEEKSYIETDLQNIVAGGFEAKESVTPMKFSSLSDLLAKRPALPAVNDLLSPEAKTTYAYKSAMAWEQGAMDYRTSQQIKQQQLQSKIMTAGNRLQQQQAQQKEFINDASRQGLMLSQEETMQVLMSSGLNLEKATEDQVMNVLADAYAKKWNISQADARTFMAMAMSNPKQAEAFLKQKYPELYSKLAANAPKAKQFVAEDSSKDNEYGKIGEQVSDISTEAQQLRNAAMDMLKHQQYVLSLENIHVGELPTNKLEDLYSRIAVSWKNSDECKQVIQIESDLQERLNNWNACTEAKQGKDIPFPSWWTQGRKQENAIIAQWNRQNAEKWLAAVAEYDNSLRALLDRLAALDNQLEQIRNGGEETIVYLDAKIQVYIAEQFLTDYYSMFSTALEFPLAVPQEETKYMFCDTYGKG
ncbi:MAG: hypothetical protein IJS92_08125 [Paludibacteraceae bacterium]|nr:hypothetical protein [Paludibacteraceae bacterium]